MRRSIATVGDKLSYLHKWDSLVNCSADRANKQPRQAGHVKLVVQPGNLKFALRPWATISEVKQRLRELANVPVSWQRLFCDGVEVGPNTRLIDLRNERNKLGRRNLLLLLKSQNPSDFASPCYLHPWAPSLTNVSGECESLIEDCLQGLKRGFAPQLLWDGTGGAYKMRDVWQNPIAVFKPGDEEPFAPNNPRGLPGRMGQPGIHDHIRSGQAHIREAIAYRLDHEHIAGVPLTLIAEAMHPAFYVHSITPLSRYGAKVGSLQAWVLHDDSASNVGTAKFPLNEVQKIALLDMRLLNTDRNDSNILVRAEGSSAWQSARGSSMRNSSVDIELLNAQSGMRSDSLFESVSMDDAELAEVVASNFWSESAASARKYELIPIDHGGCLPSKPVVMWYNWCWLSWPQLKEPPTELLQSYIASLDPVADSRILTQYSISPSAARASRCATLLIQRGVASGLTLHDCALMICRADDDVPSELELLCERASKLVTNALQNPRNLEASLLSPPVTIRRSYELEEGPQTPEAKVLQPLLASPTPAKRILRRVSSDVCIASSPPENEPEFLSPMLEETFFSYFDRMLDEAVTRKLASIARASQDCTHRVKNGLGTDSGNSSAQGEDSAEECISP